MNLSFDSFVLAAATGNLAEEPQARAHADAVELRMDLADDPLAALDAYDGDLPIIATNRAAWAGGEADESDAARVSALVDAAAHDAVAAADLELATLHTEAGADAADRIRDRGAAVIASVHDFETTPPRSALRRLLYDASRAGDVGKLAVTATDPNDALALLDATRTATAWGDRVATMAMGEPGRHTRAVAPVYGSKIGYAPVDPDRATAPGQFDLGTLSELVDALS